MPNLKIMPTAAEIAISTLGWHLKNYLTAIRPDASKIPCHINAPVSALKNASRTADVHALTTSAQEPHAVRKKQILRQSSPQALVLLPSRICPQYPAAAAEALHILHRTAYSLFSQTQKTAAQVLSYNYVGLSAKIFFQINKSISGKY